MSSDTAILTGVRSLWQEDLLQDFTIQVEGHSFKVHKVILAAVSDYFRAMLTGGMAESTNNTVQVGVVTALAMKELISFVYKDKMELTKGNVAQVLDAAMYLQIPTAVKVCVDYMVKNINFDNCYSLLSILQGYSLTDGVTEVRAYIVSNVRIILKECNGNIIPYEEFCFLMENWQGSEMDLFRYVNKWVETDLENRKQYLNDLFCKVRFCLLSSEELECIQGTELYKTFPGNWQGLFGYAVGYHQLPLHVRVLNDSEQSSLRSQPRLLCFYEDDGDHSAAALDRNKEWVALDLSPPKDCYPCKEALNVNNFLIVGPRFYVEGDWYIFDPRTLSWFQLPPTINRYEEYASVYHKEHIYVLGGFENDVVHNCIERYNFQANQWSLFINLPNTRIMHAACVFQDCIYMSGGQYHKDHSPLNKLDCLNLDTLKWESKAPMLRKASGHLMWVMKVYGEDVIFVLHDKFQFEYYNVSTDQWTSFFFTYKKFPKLNMIFGLIANGNTVYFLDDHDEGVWYNKGKCLEVTFPEEGTDVSVTSLKHIVTDVRDQGCLLWTHGAVLPLPEHKLPGLNDMAF